VLRDRALKLSSRFWRPAVWGCAAGGIVLLILSAALHSPERWGQYIGKNTPDAKMILLALGVCLLCTTAAVIREAAAHPARTLVAAVTGLVCGMGLIGLIYNAWLYPRSLNAVYS